MLIGQHRGRRQHCHLFAIHDRFERRPHGHLSFTVADVAAKQMIHRLGVLHTGFYFSDCRYLSGGLLKFKGVLHLRLPRAVLTKSMALDSFTGRIQFK